MLLILWRTIHMALTLAAVGCCAWLLWKQQHPPEPPPRGPEAPKLPVDAALRGFFHLHSLSGHYELPPGENFGLIAVLGFEDGKFVGRKARWQITGSPNGARVVSYQLLWGRNSEGKTQLAAVIATPGTLNTDISSEKTSDFFSKLNSISSTMSGSGSSEEIRGYRVLAYVASWEVRPGNSEITGTAHRIIEHRQTVAVIGVKTFPTKEEAQRAWETREPADP